MPGINTVLCDIEGTAGSISFVRDTLFPYAQKRLPGFVREHRGQAGVTAALAQTAELAGLDPTDEAAQIEQLLNWSRSDTKATPLKALQGMIWLEGYQTGAYQAHVYEDAERNLRRWYVAGMRLYVYSSGSVQAQQLFFQYSCHGDMRELFSGWFDTTSGPKTAADSYRHIAAAINEPPEAILFLSDIELELDAAQAAGLRTTLLQRPQDWPGRRATTASEHPAVADFDQVRLD